MPMVSRRANHHGREWPIGLSNPCTEEIGQELLVHIKSHVSIDKHGAWLCCPINGMAHRSHETDVNPVSCSRQVEHAHRQPKRRA